MPMRHLRHLWSIIAYSWRAIGPRRIATRLLAYSTDAAARGADSEFDARFGTDTTTGLTPAEAALPADRRRGATMYLPSMDDDLDAMLAALAWPDEQIRRATFIDVGSGKGRALFLAAMRPFRATRGVELSPVLHAIAERNLAIMRQHRALAAPIELELGDATALTVPTGPLIVYLYHPFREPIAAQLVDRIVAAVAARPRPTAILYGHPTLQRPLDEDVFCRGGLFRRQHAGARVTRNFRIGWSIWSNQDWLADVPGPTAALRRSA
ncbi:MAG: class I SAM-dependent methyltransferase [Myxococcales bacterium]|nr:class I SAM-dependent methyltransferase [Myxococcales bacterium]